MSGPSIVSLTTTIDGITEEDKAIYYKDDLLLDLPYDHSNSYKVNVTISCSFTGHPKPQVTWLLNGDTVNSSLCINGTIVTKGNTSTLQLIIFDPRPYMGSYQCEVVNEAGYVSNTTRILRKGTQTHTHAHTHQAWIKILTKN